MKTRNKVRHEEELKNERTEQARYAQLVLEINKAQAEQDADNQEIMSAEAESRPTWWMQKEMEAERQEILDADTEHRLTSWEQEKFEAEMKEINEALRAKMASDPSWLATLKEKMSDPVISGALKLKGKGRRSKSL